MEKLRNHTRIFGTVFETSRCEINRLADSRGVKKQSNLNGCNS